MFFLIRHHDLPRPAFVTKRLSVSRIRQQNYCVGKLRVEFRERKYGFVVVLCLDQQILRDAFPAHRIAAEFDAREFQHIRHAHALKEDLLAFVVLCLGLLPRKLCQVRRKKFKIFTLFIDDDQRSRFRRRSLRRGLRQRGNRRPHEQREYKQKNFHYSTCFFCLLLTAYCPLPTAYCLLPTAYCLLLTAHCSLPTAHCLLPTAHCLLRTAYCLSIVLAGDPSPPPPIYFSGRQVIS